MPARAESSGPRPAPARGEPGRVTGALPVPPRPNTRPRPAAAPLDARLNPPGEDVASRLAVEEPRPKTPPAAPPAPAPAPARAPGPERREEIDPASLTTEMEAIGDDVKKRREVDHTLARFSAVHDELAQQERQRKERRQKLMPWKSDEDDDATQYAAPVAQSIEFDDDESSGSAGRTPKHSKIVRGVKIVALTAAVLIFVTTGLGWAAMLWVDSKFTEIDALNTNSAAVHEAEKQLGDENFLIVGSDTRAGVKPEEGFGDADTEAGARSDVIMLAHVPADRKRVVVVSLPRDLRVDRPECEGWDPETGQPNGENVPQEKHVLANTAYALGGPKCVSSLMTEITHLNINHFVSVDFNGFRGMVDAVGSVNVCVPKVMNDGELGMIFDKAGKYDLGPDKALDYVRARKVLNEPNGDYDRITRQQKFLSALLRKVLSSETLLNPGKLNGFINAFASSTRGQNIGVDQLLTLAQSLQGLEAGRVSFVTIPHATAENASLSPDDNTEEIKQEETDDLFKAIIEGTPLPGETPDAAPSTPPTSGTTAPTEAPKQGAVVDPKTVKVQVLNGDENAGGVAGRTKAALADLGFTVVNTGNTAAAEKTIIKYGKGGEDAAATLNAAVPAAVRQFDESVGGAAVLVIGPGFDEEIVAPQAGGTTPPGKTPPPAGLSVVNGGADPCA